MGLSFHSFRSQVLISQNNCGQTLLQTIDHVLDFAKITKSVKEKSSRSRFGKRLKDGTRARRRDMSNGRPMDLRVLTEEVIDSVYAGRRSWKTKARTDTMASSHQTSYPAPVIIVDISLRENWTFDMDDGAWRRILMNLFSNAVKYTKRGYVRVTLDVQFDEIPGKRRPYPRLCLEVSDSGQGISQEFLKNHIYTAFKQEDSLSIGTGLGLSIVRQIILDLGGNIDIKSEVGLGPQATVSIPLLPNKVKIIDKEDLVAKVYKITAGLKACLVNSAFDLLPAISDTPTGIMSPEAKALMLLKSSVRSTLTDWFGMEVTTSSKLDLTSAKVHITMSASNVDEEIRAASFHNSDLHQVTVIVICSVLSQNPNFITESGVQVFHLQQP
jgi:two-component sensor histidine kinase